VSKTFHRRLVWRDLAYWQLYYWRDMAAQPIRPGYERMAWAEGRAAQAQLVTWQRGATGFPLVDAGALPAHSHRCPLVSTLRVCMPLDPTLP
jgi:deoxyribodipyrimidine photolyase